MLQIKPNPMPRDSHLAKPFEIRDPVHGFIALDETERQVLDSRPMQRLKHIHQLAMTYQVYPGATHKRFEHSLGVMELAGRAFEVLMGTATDDVRALLPLQDRDKVNYWRRAVRIAALCHDLGHLPFSHAAEGLLPDGWNHEQISRELILSDEMRRIWETGRPPLVAADVAKLALGPREYGRGTSSDVEDNLTDWESLLSQIITNDTFGVDRMDYLLRDSHHLGVAYGRFDHERLIRMLRVTLLRGETGTFNLGLDEGGIHAAEALLNARYFMFMQVYYHRVRVAYDHHLACFLEGWLPGGTYSIDLNEHLKLTDNEVTAGSSLHAADAASVSHQHANAIMNRHHFKQLYVARDYFDSEKSEAIDELEVVCRRKYGEDVCVLAKPVRFTASQVTVRRRDDSLVAFDTYSDMAPARLNSKLRFILIRPDLHSDALRWIGIEKKRLGIEDTD